MHLGLIAAGCLAAFCAFGPAEAQQAGAVSEQTADKAVDSMVQQYVKLYNDGNAAGVAGLFTRDGVFLTPAGTVLTGQRDIKTAYEGRMKAGWTHQTANAKQVRVAGNSIWYFGEWAIAGTGPNSGKQIGGYYASVLDREGSEWRMSLLVGNLKPAQDVTGMAPPTTPK